MQHYVTSRWKMPQPRKRYVQRRSLYAKLSQVTQYALTMMEGSAGSGKTTLLSSYFKEQQELPIWFTLDEDCDDFYVFFDYFIHAIPCLQQDAFLSSYMMAQRQEDSKILAAFLLEKLENASMVLVLDNVHIIKNERVLQALTYLFQHLPNGIHVVLCGRRMPKIHLHQMFMQNEILIIEAFELRLQEDEAMQFLKETLQIEQDDDYLHMLCQKANGWIGGLQLMSIAKQSQSFASFSNQLLHEYITQEIYQELSFEVQHFLVTTSILRSFDVHFCNAYLQIEESKELLQTLWKQRFILIVLDEEAELFTYHDLLKEYLQHLFEQLDVTQQQHYHRRAAQICYENKEIQECLHHLFCIPDYASAMEIITSTPQGSEVLYYLKKVPLEVICDNPDFAYQYYFYHYGNYEEEACQQMYPLIMERLKDTPTIAAFESSLSIIQGQSISPSMNVLPLKDLLRLPLKKETLMFTLLKDAFLLIYTSDYEESIKRIDAAKSFYEQTKNLYAGMMIYMEYAQIHEAFGYFQKALHAYEEMKALLKVMPIHDRSYEIGLAGVYIRQMKLKEAEALLDHVEKQENQDSDSLAMAEIHTRAQWYCAKGEKKGVEQILKQLQTNDLYANKEALAVILKLYYPLHPNAGIFQQMFTNWKAYPFQGIVHADTYVIYILMLLHKKAYDEALALLQLMSKDARRLMNKYVLVETNVLKLCILLHQQQSEGRMFFTIALEAICLASDEEIRLPFLHLTNQFPKAIYRQLLEVLDTEQRKFIDTLMLYQQGTKLTNREIDVLALLAEGKLNKEIAMSLSISTSTVKTHILHIYEKLEVENRVEATKLYELFYKQRA